MSLLDVKEIDDFTIYESKIKEMLKKYWVSGIMRFDIDQMEMVWDGVPGKYDVLMHNLDSNKLILKFVTYALRGRVATYNHDRFIEVIIKSEALDIPISVEWRTVKLYIETGKL